MQCQDLPYLWFWRDKNLRVKTTIVSLKKKKSKAYINILPEDYTIFIDHPHNIYYKILFHFDWILDFNIKIVL